MTTVPSTRRDTAVVAGPSGVVAVRQIAPPSVTRKVGSPRPRRTTPSTPATSTTKSGRHSRIMVVRGNVARPCFRAPARSA